MKKLVKRSLLSILALSTILSFSNFNDIQAKEITDYEKIVIEKLEKEGISKEKQVSLLNKIKEGYLPDSVTGEIKVTPVIEKKFNGDLEYKYFYPDGSFSSTTMSKETVNTPMFFNALIDGGDLRTGSQWWSRTRMRIHHDYLVGTIGFYADASGSPNYGKIDRVYGEWATAYIAGSFSDVNLNKYSDNHARISANLTSWGGFSSRLMKLNFYLYSMNNYYSEYAG